LAEWLYEAGIGENRAALIDGGYIVEMLIERHESALRLGAVIDARLIRRLPHSDRSMFALLGEPGGEVIGHAPASITEGQQLRVMVTREAIPEAGNPKAPTVRAAEPGAALSPGLTLLQRIEESGQPVSELLPHEQDRLEACGWSERLGEAESGLIPFEGGLLRIAITPAMTLIDVDGALAPMELALAGAAAAARAIRLFDIGGSIGLDLPSPQHTAKALRTQIGTKIDAILPQPFERTALNGFGFVQIVRRRLRASVTELIQSDRVTASAMALLRRAQRAGGRGAITLSGAPAVIHRIDREEAWRNALARRRGAPVHLSERDGAAISDVHAESEFP
jgi:hypothetical protein